MYNWGILYNLFSNSKIKNVYIYIVFYFLLFIINKHIAFNNAYSKSGSELIKRSITLFLNLFLKIYKDHKYNILQRYNFNLLYCNIHIVTFLSYNFTILCNCFNMHQASRMPVPYISF